MPYSTCSHCDQSVQIGQMSEETFSEFVRACNEELIEKQIQFESTLSNADKWFYDLTGCELTIGQQKFRITPVGTHSSKDDTWLWAWANETFPQPARESSKQLQALHTVTGWDQFTTEGMTATAADAQIFASLAVHVSGALGVFRNTTEDITIYLALHGL